MIRNKSYGFVEVLVLENGGSSNVSYDTGAGEHLWINYSKVSSVALTSIAIAVTSGEFGVMVDDTIISDDGDAMLIIPNAHADLVSIKNKYDSS